MIYIIYFLLVDVVLKFIIIAKSEEIMDSTKEKFKITQFIKEAERYTGNFFEDMDLGEMLNQAMQGKIDNKSISLFLLENDNELAIIAGSNA